MLFICRSERREKEAVGEKVSDLSTSRVEREYLKPRYTTSIADQEVEGLFDGRSNKVLMSLYLQKPNQDE